MVRPEPQWLINGPEEIISIVRADRGESNNVLFGARWWQATHEVEHGVDYITHCGLVSWGNLRDCKYSKVLCTVTEVDSVG